MYGFPYMDHFGDYGISKRDNYVLSGLSDNEFKNIFNFLCSDVVYFLMETTRYKMKYLERYVFDFIPNILKMKKEGVNIEFNKEYILSVMDVNNREVDNIDGLFEKYFVSKYSNFKYNIEK